MTSSLATISMAVFLPRSIWFPAAFSEMKTAVLRGFLGFLGNLDLNFFISNFGSPWYFFKNIPSPFKNVSLHAASDQQACNMSRTSERMPRHCVDFGSWSSLVGWVPIEFRECK